jgi:hypothetical protein
MFQAVCQVPDAGYILGTGTGIGSKIVKNSKNSKMINKYSFKL